MSILDTVFRRREPAVKYRTVDGGHPAPYPDMTDEQLYNYEMTFNVPKKTFDSPPGIAKVRTDAVPGKIEPRFSPQHSTERDPSVVTGERREGRPAVSLDSGDATGSQSVPRDEPQMSAPEQEQEPHEEAEQARDFSATHTSRPEAGKEQPAQPALPPLDFSKPVRTVTTRQPVEIVTTRARHPVFKVLGYIGDNQVATLFTLGGQISENGPRFLENVPQRRSLYLNIYMNRSTDGPERFYLTEHETREAADAAATVDRLACVPVEFDLF